MGHINAIQDDPELGDFEFRAHTEWMNGARARTEIQGFYGAGEEDESRDEPFVLTGDEPPLLLGDNAGPNAVETVLHGLASCLAVGMAYNAAVEGIKIESLEFDLEGTADLRAFLGITDEVRPGFQDVSVNYRIESNANQEEIEELCKYVQETSPVVDMLRKPVPIDISVER